MHVATNCMQKPRATAFKIQPQQFPTSIWLVCRQIYHEVQAVVPLVHLSLHIQSELHLMHSLRQNLRMLLSTMPPKWLRTIERLTVNQAGVAGLDLGILDDPLSQVYTIDITLHETYGSYEQINLPLAPTGTGVPKTVLEKPSELLPLHSLYGKWILPRLRDIFLERLNSISVRAEQTVQVWHLGKPFLLLVWHYYQCE